jgi:hypothetical protein
MLIETAKAASIMSPSHKRHRQLLPKGLTEDLRAIAGNDDHAEEKLF